MGPEEKKARAREKAREYYYANIERCLERGRAWRAANKEKVKANNAAYHAENREREIVRNRAWKDENREAMNARRRTAYAANIERERAYMRECKKLRYWRNPQKYRDLARLERAMPGAKEKQAAWGNAWAARNRERVKASRAGWYAQNGDRVRQKAKAAYRRDPQRHRNINRRNYFLNRARYGVTQKAWAARNAARVRTYQKQWRVRNPGVARARASEARALRLKRRLAWASAGAIASLHREAQLLTETTGRLHVVDHIIPLRAARYQVLMSRITCASLRHPLTHARPTSGNHRDGSAHASCWAMCRSRRAMRQPRS